MGGKKRPLSPTLQTTAEVCLGWIMLKGNMIYPVSDRNGNSDDPVSTEEMKKVVEIWKVTWPNSINLLKTRRRPGHLTVLQHGDGTQSTYKAGITQTLADSTPKKQPHQSETGHQSENVTYSVTDRIQWCTEKERSGGVCQNSGDGPAPPTDRPELRHAEGAPG